MLIANRGEIAIRIARACADLGIRSVAVFAEDDAASLHVRKADVALPLAGRGVAAYLDMDRLVALALEQGCEAIHPGYGFLAENGEFARRCQRAGIHFVGPQAEVLDLFGDKAAARALAERLEVPLVAGINRAASVEEAEAFLEGLGDGAAVMLKALAGGGGRGMRAVEEVAQLADAYRRCRAEAQAAFGRDELYVEQRVARARHIEVQVLGDGSGAVSHLWERDCSLQRRQQKLLEIAPSPDLPEATREALIDCALRMAGAVRYRGSVPSSSWSTTSAPGASISWKPIRASRWSTPSPRKSPGSTCCTPSCVSPPAWSLPPSAWSDRRRSAAARCNCGSTWRPWRPTAAPVRRWALSAPTNRPAVPACGWTATAMPAIGSAPATIRCWPSWSCVVDYPAALRRAYRALCEFRLEGVASNLDLLRNLLLHPAVQANRVDTRFVESHLETLLAPIPASHPRLRAECPLAEDAAPARVEAPLGSLPLSAPSSGCWWPWKWPRANGCVPASGSRSWKR